MIHEGNIVKIDQDHKVATYEPPCKGNLTQIRWYEDANIIYSLIRGCDPSPGAYTMYDGKKLSIFDCELRRDDHQVGWCGKILKIHENGFDVRLNGGVLVVKRVMPEGGKKIPANEWAASVNLKVDYRFALS